MKKIILLSILFLSFLNIPILQANNSNGKEIPRIGWQYTGKMPLSGARTYNQGRGRDRESAFRYKYINRNYFNRNDLNTITFTPKGSNRTETGYHFKARGNNPNLDGQCVSLIQRLNIIPKSTSTWTKGASLFYKARNNKIRVNRELNGRKAKGYVIATFDEDGNYSGYTKSNGKYQVQHVGIMEYAFSRKNIVYVKIIDQNWVGYSDGHSSTNSLLGRHWLKLDETDLQHWHVVKSK